MTCPVCGCTWCYAGDHEPGQQLPGRCEACRCTTPMRHWRQHYPTLEDAERAVARAYRSPETEGEKRLAGVYPCGGHWHVTSQVRAAIRVTVRGRGEVGVLDGPARVGL